ncbi:MAG: DUF1559 domain-containing protein [Pseudomonadota bacterium]
MRRDSQRFRRAFTLVELLVVIAIIGVLVGLLLPAVQSVRLAAQRTQCANNIRQLVLAVHNYHDSIGHIPTTTTGPDLTADAPNGGFYSWMALILPHIEQGNLYNSIDFSLTLADSTSYPSSSSYLDYSISPDHPNAGAAATIVSTFLCPSDPVNGLQSHDNGELLAPGNYAGNVGWARSSFIVGNEPIERQNGVFGLSNPSAPDTWHFPEVTFQSISDGLSNTAAISERKISDLKIIETAFGQFVDPDSDENLQSFCGSGLASRSLQRWQSYLGGVSASDPRYAEKHGHAWISGWSFAANTYMHVMPINQRNGHIYGGEGIGYNIVTPGSYHPGGINVTFADGSTHFISESIDINVWWALGSIDGGEIVDEY